MSKLTMIDLFAGIGGMALGADWVFGDQIKHLAFCEINPFGQRVLRHHWGDVPIIPDIKDFDHDSIKADRASIVTGGFPCQPFSIAGRQGGKADDRYLWGEMLRVIKIFKPTWVLAENVYGLINMALDTVLFDLEAEGYETWAFVLGACAIDSPHIRKRVFILGNAKHDGSYQTEVRRSDHESPEPPKQDTLWEPAGASGVQSGAEDVSDTAGKRVEGLRTCGEQESQAYVRQGISLCKRQGSGCSGCRPMSRLDMSPDGFSRWVAERTGYRWQIEAGDELPYWDSIPRVTHDRTDRAAKIEALGNAVVPALTVPFFEFIKIKEG